jgi:dihydropteroate synthase
VTETTLQPKSLQLGRVLVDFSRRPYIMGVLNVTPDSFSDGGRFFRPQDALEQARRLIAEGADILDIGGESSRPGSDPVTVEEELRRVLPVVEKLAAESPVPISIDTTKAEVARRALRAGAAMINDISALRFDPRLAQVVAEAGAPLCLMHMRGEPKTMQQGPIVYRDLLGEIAAFLQDAMERARAAGIERDKIILDPGIGFGKTAEHNLTILRRLDYFHRLGRPLLVGVSRKSFIGQILDLPPQERLFGTAAAVAAAVLAGAHILRVHDVAVMRQVALVAHAIRRERLPALEKQHDH